jgi:hypothetical protein
MDDERGGWGIEIESGDGNAVLWFDGPHEVCLALERVLDGHLGYREWLVLNQYRRGGLHYIAVVFILVERFNAVWEGSHAILRWGPADGFAEIE